MTELPHPNITEINKPFWDGLKNGELLFQECQNGHRWLPASDFCPHCLSSNFKFTKSSGQGKLISWVVYNTAHHPAFQNKVPYNVAIIKLDEGPQLISNILCPNEKLTPDMRLRLTIEQEGEMYLAKFFPQLHDNHT